MSYSLALTIRREFKDISCFIVSLIFDISVLHTSNVFDIINQNKVKQYIK